MRVSARLHSYRDAYIYSTFIYAYVWLLMLSVFSQRLGYESLYGCFKSICRMNILRKHEVNILHVGLWQLR